MKHVRTAVYRMLWRKPSGKLQRRRYRGYDGYIMAMDSVVKSGGDPLASVSMGRYKMRAKRECR